MDTVNLATGRAFTQTLRRAWLEEAGFATLECALLPGGQSVIRAGKGV